MTDVNEGNDKFSLKLNRKAFWSMVVAIGCITVFASVFISYGNRNASVSGLNEVTSNVTELDGKQIISITVKGGYRPNAVVAKAGKETILKLTTNNTYDCSSAISIPKLGYSKYLDSTGVTEITIPIQTKDSIISGSCSMGMYNFKIKFI